MSPSIHQSYRLAVGTCVALGMMGCLCPPCAPEPSTVEKVAPGSKLVLWDGDESKGQNAQGWADCDQKPGCQGKFSVIAKEGVDGSTALRFHGAGAGWIGGGWNLFGWWPENAGFDISQYDDLTFMIRTQSPEPALNVDPGSVGVGMRCSNGKKDSASANVLQRARGFADGRWHRVVIPLRELRKGKEGKAFDLHTAWEFVFSTWAASKRSFDVYLDDIAVEKRK
jgi:hypothetical protein